MKKDQSFKNAPITAPLLKDLMDRQKENTQMIPQAPLVGSTPLEASDLFQDPGAGYNLNFTFPQE